MEKICYILICHFGLEKVLKSEIRKLGLEISEVSDGEIKAIGTIEDLPRLNFNLRTSERVMIELSNFKATTFEELFSNVEKINITIFRMNSQSSRKVIVEVNTCKNDNS